MHHDGWFLASAGRSPTLFGSSSALESLSRSLVRVTQTEVWLTCGCLYGSLRRAGRRYRLSERSWCGISRPPSRDGLRPGAGESLPWGGWAGAGGLPWWAWAGCRGPAMREMDWSRPPRADWGHTAHLCPWHWEARGKWDEAWWHFCVPGVWHLGASFLSRSGPQSTDPQTTSAQLHCSTESSWGPILECCSFIDMPLPFSKDPLAWVVIGGQERWR